MRSTVLLSTTDLERLGSTHSTQYSAHWILATLDIAAYSDLIPNGTRSFVIT